jgi:mannose-6-phosphate isomerase-like protein (cupin superfamily)
MTRARDAEAPIAINPAVNSPGVRSAQVLMSCDTLEPTLGFFTGRLGFRIDAIYPADDPSTAEISGHGLGIRLVRGASGGVSILYLICDDPKAIGAGAMSLRAPNGVTVELVAASPPMLLPATKQALALTRASEASWKTGRAGMQYRDLLPERHGGAFIVSHIRILEGGEVPDYVHFHRIRFQAIFCRKGWVRVVYEGQGDAFLLEAGDCVLQPPLIRHRVLESSAGAEVVEIGAPAEHVTRADHELALPTSEQYPDRDFSGQRFVRHVAATATWAPWRVRGFEASDTGIAEATNGLAGMRVLRAKGAQAAAPQRHDAEFCFYFVLRGAVTVELEDMPRVLTADDSIAIPSGMAYTLANASNDLELLEITLPGEIGNAPGISARPVSG